MTEELTLAQRLRVSAALNDEVKLTLGRDDILSLVHILEFYDGAHPKLDAALCNMRAVTVAAHKTEESLMWRLLACAATVDAIRWLL